MGYGEGFGKVILIGEHFVVGGNHEIICGINSKTTAHAERIIGKDYELIDNRIETPGYKAEKYGQQKESMQYIFKALNHDPKKKPVRITLGGDLVAASGIGASAASCAAIARALNDEFRLGLSVKQLNEVAFQGELGYTGTPSGGDNTAAIFGGLLWFQKGVPPKFEKIKSKKRLEIVMGDTGIVANTKELVSMVMKRRQKEPEKYGKIFEEAEELAFNARKALEKGNVMEFAGHMTRNQELLRDIGVSHPRLEEQIQIARENGALAAKLTGGGGGGYIVALTPGKELQTRVSQALEKKGYRTIKTTVG